MTKQFSLAIGVAIAATATAPTAFAQTDGRQQTEVTALSPFATDVVDDAALQSIAGREDTTQIATNQQTADVSRNTVGDNVQTGDARISDSAFQNMSGLSILNVNTGNNVAINAGMNVNISLSPGP